jgi:scyllo-inositol 2-dehydrogenase (NADP+)
MTPRVVVVGLGVQGRKRAAVAGPDVVATVDPTVADADYRRLDAVAPDSYDAAVLCVPDAPKLELIQGLLAAGKAVLVEKPLLITPTEADALTRIQGGLCYTAYNHRFEPHIVRVRDAVARGDLGRIYRARLFYGNGTARDVRASGWRDQPPGVLNDLGSHLLDMLDFVFGGWPELSVWSASRFENRAFDHIVVGGNASGDLPMVELEMSLLSWRNHFVFEVYGERGSLHVESLCKWGPSTFTHRVRVLPSGRPSEEAVTLVQPDPTWALEYAHFKDCWAAGRGGDLARDARIARALSALAEQALETSP